MLTNHSMDSPVRFACLLVVNNLAVQALSPHFASDKAIVDARAGVYCQRSARTTVGEATAE